MPLRGDCGHLDTQGVALGYVLVGLSGRTPSHCHDKWRTIAGAVGNMSATTNGGVLAGRTIAGAVGNK